MLVFTEGLGVLTGEEEGLGVLLATKLNFSVACDPPKRDLVN